MKNSLIADKIDKIVRGVIDGETEYITKKQFCWYAYTTNCIIINEWIGNVDRAGFAYLRGLRLKK